MVTWRVEFSDDEFRAIEVLSQAWIDLAGELIGVDNDRAERVMNASSVFVTALTRAQPVGLEATV